MKKQVKAIRMNTNLAKATWGRLSRTVRQGLEELTSRYSLSVALGDVQYLDGRWYVTHAGLLRIAHRNRCSGIRATVEKGLSDPASSRWVFRATVYKSPSSRGFVGYGDADPSNVSSLVHGAEMRVAETRAVNRALRRPMASGSARSRNSAGLLNPTFLAHPISARLPRTEITATTIPSLASATAYACSFASISSMLSL
jgi:hypothetical protein